MPDQTYLAGKLLLAMPSIGDPRFDHAVIYICAHDENGAMGLGINQKAMGVEFKAVLDQLGITSDIEIDPSQLSNNVFNGGPVETGRGFLLHTPEFIRKETVKVDDHFHVTGSVDALKDIAHGKGPEDFLFILGYAGWSPGQLEAELKQNAWLVTDASAELLFDGIPAEKWTKAVATLGFDPAMLSGNTGIGRA